MDRKKFWMFLVIGIAIGSGMEWLKRSAPSPWRAPKLMIAEEAHSERRPRALGARRPLPKLPVETKAAIAGLAPVAAAPAKAPSATAQAAKKKDEKKKKKKEEKKIAPATPVMKIQGDEAKEKAKAKEVESPSALSYGIPGSAAPETYVPRTLEDWRAYLLSRADRYRVELLIKQYKSGAVPSEVFYEVVQEMLADSRPEMRRLALYCLSSTPSEPSFASLVVFLASNPANAERSEAQTYLNSYGDRRNLPILTAALQAIGNADVNIQAMNVLRASVDRTIPSLVATNSTGRVPSTNGPPPGAATGGSSTTGPDGRPLTPQQQEQLQQQRAATVRQYVSMTQLLNRLAGTYPSAQLRRAATDTSAHIQSVFANNGLSLASL